MKTVTEIQYMISELRAQIELLTHLDLMPETREYLQKTEIRLRLEKIELLQNVLNENPF